MVLLVLVLGPEAGPAVVQRSWPMMGTFAEVTLDAEDDERAKRAIEAVRTVFDRVNRTMTVYDPKSDLNRVNRWAGFRSVGVDPWVAKLVAYGKEAQWVTRGAFRLSTLAEGIERGLKPEVVNTVPGDYGVASIDVRTNPSRIRLRRAGMGLDLGGIAKGFALDRASEELRERGFDRYLINLGRSLAAGESPRGRDGWTVKISGKTKPRTVRNVVLSTSRQGVRSDTDHIVTEQKNGPKPARQVTVAASRGWVSDFASTALLVNPELENHIRNYYEGLKEVWIDSRNRKKFFGPSSDGHRTNGRSNDPGTGGGRSTLRDS